MSATPQFQDGQILLRKCARTHLRKGRNRTSAVTVKYHGTVGEWAVVSCANTRAGMPYCVLLRELFAIPEDKPHCKKCAKIEVTGTFVHDPKHGSTQPYRLELPLIGRIHIGGYFDTLAEARATACMSGFEIKESETRSRVMKVQGRYVTPDGKVHIDFGITDQGYFVASGHFNGKSGQCIEEIEASPYGAHREIAQLAQNWRFDHLKKANQKLIDWCIAFAAKHPLKP